MQQWVIRNAMIDEKNNKYGSVNDAESVVDVLPPNQRMAEVNNVGKVKIMSKVNSVSK